MDKPTIDDIIPYLKGLSFEALAQIYSNIVLLQTVSGKIWKKKLPNENDIVLLLRRLSPEELSNVLQDILSIPKDKIDLVSIEYCYLTRGNRQAIPIQSHGKRFRQLSPAHWPRKNTNIHYEFIRIRNGVGVEIPFEPRHGNWAISVTETARNFMSPLKEIFPTMNIDWLVDSGEQAYRLSIQFPESEPPSTIAQAMLKLVDLTYFEMDKALTRAGLIN